MSSPESQPQLATGLCYPPGQTDDSSCQHPAFTTWFVPTILRPQPGEHVLDLACGTGLITLTVSSAVGAKGSVVGIDARGTMIEEAEASLRQQQQQRGEMGRVSFLRHDVVDLGSCSALRGCEGRFDAVVCVSVLDLLEDAEAAVKGWMRFLRPGGRIVLDALHERSWLVALCLGRTFERMGFMAPYNRGMVKDEESFRELLKRVGLTVEEVVLRKQRDGDSVRRVEEVDAAWDEAIVSGAARELRSNEEMLQRAKEIFKEEWSKLADGGGNLYDVDGMYVARARKPYDSSPNAEILATGSCACGAIKWTSTALPFSLNFCHCISCRKASGGAFQAFMDFETDAVRFDSRNPPVMKHVALSKNARRGFCSECGSSMTMQYNVDPEEMGVCAGSLDESSIEGGIRALDGIKKKHIFVKDNVGWYDIPSDGYERQEDMKSASRLLIHKD